jgi:hypothetical protein
MAVVEAHGSTAPNPVQGGTATDDLKGFVTAHATLLGAVGIMTGLATFVSRGLGPDWTDTLLRFLLIGMAFLLWLELLTQCPPSLLLTHAPAPAGTSWRLVGFAYALQLTMVGFIANAVWRQPQLLVPALGLAAGMWLWTALPQHAREQRSTLVGVAVAAILTALLVLALVDPPTQTLLQRLWQEIRPR